MRTSSETSEHIVNQFATALQPNVVTTLSDAVRSSGIKDAMAQPIIESLVKLGQQLRKNSPDQVAYSPDEVCSILLQELKSKTGEGGAGGMNPLLHMDGQSTNLLR